MGVPSDPDVLQSSVDDLYFSALSDDDVVFPISDEKYADGIQFQEALMSSAISSTTRSPKQQQQQQPHLHLSCATPAKPLHVLESGQCSTVPSGTSKLVKVTKEVGESSTSKLVNVTEEVIGEPSSSGTICKICAEPKLPEDMFSSSNCSHLFCKDCVGRHIATKVQENIAIVKCPDADCRGVLEVEECRGVVPDEVFGRWGDALCESMVLGLERFYCPFKDCSVLLVDDSGEKVTQSECGACRRLFCAQCKAAWHAGVSCEEYQRLGGDEREREDLQLVSLARSGSWKRCPRCRFYVEKKEGCLHITCRCMFEFCYGCGSGWSSTHTCCHT